MLHHSSRLRGAVFYCSAELAQSILTIALRFCDRSQMKPLVVTAMPHSAAAKHFLLLRLCLVYALAIALWLLLRLMFFDRLWWLAMVNTLALYVFVPLPVLLLWGGWQRQGWALTLLSIPIVAGVLLYGSLFVPNQTANEAANLSVMTFNVLYSNGDDVAIGQAIRTGGADIVGLQEYTPRHADTLPQMLQAQYPYHAETSTSGGTGVGLLSRFPIERAEPFPLPPRNLALHTVLRVDDRPLHVVIVHLEANHLYRQPLAKLARSAHSYYAKKAAEVKFIQQEIRSVQEPLLVLCDCNFTDTSQSYADLRKLLNDSFAEAGWGLGHTFPTFAPVPLVRLDYIWHSDRVRAIAAKVGADGRSDHLPVVVQLSW